MIKRLPHKGNFGFTLIELLLYVSLMGVVVMATTVFLTVLQKQRVRSQVIMEVESQGIKLMQNFTQIVRNSTSISSPAVGVSSSSLTLVVPTGSLSPTVFGLSSGVVTMTEGVNPVVNLTSGKVIVSGLTFSNYSRASTKGNIRVQFVVSYNNPDGISEYTFSKTFISSASLR